MSENTYNRAILKMSFFVPLLYLCFFIGLCLCLLNVINLNKNKVNLIHGLSCKIIRKSVKIRV